MISKPLLAEKVIDLNLIQYPCLVTPKIDGIRALVLDGKLLSRSLHPIRNVTISKILEDILPNGSDGEIVCGSTFQDVSSMVMTFIGSEGFKDKFTYYWFDYVKDSPSKPYVQRVEDIYNYVKKNSDLLKHHHQAEIIPLIPVTIYEVSELLKYQKEVLSKNFEGVMIRRPDGCYKMGRSTLKEGILLKLKEFEDDEATIIDVVEKMHNKNESKKNELGLTKRSWCKSGLSPANTLGSLVVKKENIIFNIGTGYNDIQRKKLWESRDNIIGKIVKYKYFEKGMKTAPRFPVFIGFRDVEDMDKVSTRIKEI